MPRLGWRAICYLLFGSSRVSLGWAQTLPARGEALCLEIRGEYFGRERRTGAFAITAGRDCEAGADPGGSVLTLNF